jgi:hypothetical protein
VQDDLLEKVTKIVPTKRIDQVVTDGLPAVNSNHSKYNTGYEPVRPVKCHRSTSNMKTESLGDVFGLAIGGSYSAPYAIDEHDRTKTKNDTQSLAFKNERTNSPVSRENIMARWTEETLISFFLVENHRIRALCGRVLARTSKTRFAISSPRLLGSFCTNLLTETRPLEARSKGELSVSMLLGDRAARLRIHQRLIGLIEGQVRGLNKHDLSIPAYEKYSLAYLVVRLSNASAELSEKDAHIQDSDNDELTEPGHDELRFKSDVKEILEESESLRGLTLDLVLWLLPVDLREVLLSVPRGCVWVAEDQDVTWINTAKAWVEDNTQVDWNWWPLQARRRTLESDESLLYWRCVCVVLVIIFLTLTYCRPVATYSGLRCAPNTMTSWSA